MPNPLNGNVIFGSLNEKGFDWVGLVLHRAIILLGMVDFPTYRKTLLVKETLVPFRLLTSVTVDGVYVFPLVILQSGGTRSIAARIPTRNVLRLRFRRHLHIS